MNPKDVGSGAWQVLKTVAPTIAATAAGPFAPHMFDALPLLTEPIDAEMHGITFPQE